MAVAFQALQTGPKLNAGDAARTREAQCEACERWQDRGLEDHQFLNSYDYLSCIQNYHPSIQEKVCCQADLAGTVRTERFVDCGT